MTTRIFFIALALMLIVAGSTALFRKNRADSIVPSACTQEALVCPDGTSVGRTRVQCAFEACPQASSYTGTLTQQGDEYFLVIGSSATTGEVSYSLPLDIQASSMGSEPSSLVNEHVTVHGRYSEGTTYAVDTLEALPGNTNAGNSADVTIGQTVFINGVRVTLNKIVSDNRCPVDVQCIQAGKVTASVTLKSDTDNETVDLDSPGAAHAFDSYQVSMISVMPSRVAAAAPTASSYIVTVKVDANSMPISKPVSDDAMFTGTISAYDTGCFADATCSVTIDGKVVIITTGGRSMGSAAVGTLQGVASIGDLETKIGHTASVFAHKNSDTQYTLYGKSAYYVKVQ